MNRQSLGIRCLYPLLSVALLLSASSDAAEPPLETSRHDDGRGTLKLVIPPPGTAPAGKGQAGAENFLRQHAADFKLPNDLSNLQLVASRESLLGTHYRFQQLLNGIPVDTGEIVVSISRDNGEVFQVYNNTHPVEAPVANKGAAVDKAAALDIAWSHLRVHGKLLGNPRADLVYEAVKGGFRLVYKTYTAVEAPFGYWEHRIDADTSEVLAVRDTAINESEAARVLPDFATYEGPIWSRAKATGEWEISESQRKAAEASNKNRVDGTAMVFDGDPRTYLANAALVDSSSASAFSGAYVQRTLRGISETNGVYSLEGPWVIIANFESPNTAPSTTANGQWTSARGNNAFNDAMTYFHIDQNQRYLQSLGYTGATGIQYGPIPTDSDGLSGADNSHYVPSANQLAFGHGGVDDNEDADVILHEYGHAITYSIVPTWSGGDAGGIGEGFGDYWGASYSSTMTNGRTFHPEWAFSWDGHSADTWSGRLLNLTNLTYDSNHTYTAHETISSIANYSDQLWSAPLWQSFQTLQAMGYPRTNIDKIVLESFFGLGSNAKMRDLANATVNAALRLFPGQPYAGVFQQNFQNQSILVAPQLATPLVLYPGAGKLFSTGTVLQVRWSSQGAPAAAAARLEYTSGATVTFTDTMENGIGGWVASHGAGSTDWIQGTASSHSATHSWFAADAATAADMYLKSPAIAVGAGDTLTFWHSYNFESGFDGGVVEISTNGTTWTDLGSSSTENGYNGSISTGYSSAIAGRSAFTGSGSTYRQTTIPLTPYAGATIYIRFRAASDTSVGSTGWYVDDVMVGRKWSSLGSVAAGVTNYAWKLPASPGTNYQVRIQQFAPGYNTSSWVESPTFSVVSALPLAIRPMRILNSNAVLTWTAITGATYRVEMKTNLGDLNWVSISPDLIANGDTVSFTNQMLQRRFYRITVP